jgi:hypothetical protein
MGCEVHHNLKNVINKLYGQDATNVGDEGGFCPFHSGTTLSLFVGDCTQRCVGVYAELVHTNYSVCTVRSAWSDVASSNTGCRAVQRCSAARGSTYTIEGVCVSVYLNRARDHKYGIRNPSALYSCGGVSATSEKPSTMLRVLSRDADSTMDVLPPPGYPACADTAHINRETQST